MASLLPETPSARGVGSASQQHPWVDSTTLTAPGDGTDVELAAAVNPEIEAISIPYGFGISDVGLQAVAACCRRLTSFQAERCEHVTDSGIEAVANGCANMRSVDVGNCEQVTDNGIVAVANGCLKLTSLNVKGCRQVTDTGIVAVANRRPNLTSLNARNCGQITDTGIMAVANGCPNLTSLIVGGCGQVTDTGIVAVASGCPSLTSLNVEGCWQVTDTGIVAVANSCPNLTSLIVGYCDQVTDTGIMAVANGCPHLTSLSVWTCQQVTKARLEAFRLAAGLARVARVVHGSIEDGSVFSVELDRHHWLLRRSTFGGALLVLGNPGWLEPCEVGAVAVAEVVLSDAACKEATAACIDARLAWRRVFVRVVLGSTLRTGNSTCKLSLLGGGGVQTNARKLVAEFLDVPIQSEPANLRAVLAMLQEGA